MVYTLVVLYFYKVGEAFIYFIRYLCTEYYVVVSLRFNLIERRNFYERIEEERTYGR